MKPVCFINKEKYFHHTPALLAVLVIVLSMLLSVLVFLRPGHHLYAYAPYAFYILQPEETKEEIISDYAGIRRTYTFTIPEGQATTIGARLSFYLHHTYASVYMEDSELTYDSSELDTPHIGHTPGNYWLTIPVRPVYAGKKVHVTLTPVFASVSEDVPVFWLIGHEQLLNMIILPQDAFILSLSIVAVLSGMFLFILALIVPLDRNTRHPVLLAGATTVTAGLWKISGLSSILLMLDFTGYHKALWYFGAVMYLLMLLFSLQFLVCSFNGPRSTVCSICECLLSVAAVLLLLMQILGALELHDFLAWYGTAAGLLHLIVILSRRHFFPQLLWSLLFFLTLEADFAVYVFTGTIHNAPFFLCLTILCLFIRGFGFIRSSILTERALKEQEVMLRNAQIQSMVQQIRPHFIFNTLTSIYVLCREDPSMAMAAIQDFTSYLQANFTAISMNQLISFTDELRHTQAYLAVEDLCYGNRLNITYDLQTTAFRLPPLTLQPIVENAVKHGVGAGQKSGHLMIRTFMKGEDAVICVEDDGPGLLQESIDETNHIGIRNVSDRLRIMCNGTLHIRNRQEGGTVVTITIPKPQ